MIRINLLGLKKEIKKSAAPAVSLAGTALTIAAVAFLVAGLAWDYYRYYSLSSEGDRIAADFKKANLEKTRLAGVKAQYDALQATEAQLTKQIDVISALERARTGPVEMLAALANTVVSTKTMWLTTFDNTGDKVHMTGFATSADTVADFMRNLKDTGRFTSVELTDTSQDDAKDRGYTAFQFELNAQLVNGAPAPQPAGGKK
jgi:type IV pilus assembly protein PilN